MTFSSLPVRTVNLTDVTIQIDGKLLVSKDFESLPAKSDFLMFFGAKNLTFKGEGVIDGQGYMWWIREYLQKNVNGRPNLVIINESSNVEWSGIRLINSPQFHLSMRNVDQGYFHDFEIHADVRRQKELGQLLQGDPSGLGVPTFPLNTDGIDPSGRDILIERVNITNFDDAIAIKPGNRDGQIPCAENILVRDMNIWWSVGLSVGSVTPKDSYSCIRNITFKDSKMYHPIKAIYVKTNPGTTTSMLPGSGGEITGITYENIEIHKPIWWGIYIGPQQQKQPGGEGPGCMFYPFGDCATQPLISLNNITLDNIRQYDSILPPGIIRCDETNPCSGFIWSNVHSTAYADWWKFLGLGYISENVIGTVTDSLPDPKLDGGVHDLKVSWLAKKLIKKFICAHFSWLPCEETN